MLNVDKRYVEGLAEEQGKLLSFVSWGFHANSNELE